eukprot:TRINITY_DN3678_c0_g1_i1.p1 TRINITY_DN3678_c0_g1~~TRINITY_DN3678_c0_g1_i1.p1  ORF type:complete len:373 (+),score=58.89 TRINITY_DN3678_c0_g1_i1:134-1252(+)
MTAPTNKVEPLPPTHIHAQIIAIDDLKHITKTKAIHRDEDKRITSYSTKILFYFGFMHPKGSIWNSAIVIRIVFMCGLTTLFGLLSCKTADAKWEFCFPILNSSDGLIFSSLVSFLLGMFQTLTFNRWWSVREKIGLVQTRSTDLCIQFLSYLKPSPENDAVRTNFVRYLNLAHILVYKNANGDHSIDEVVERNLLSQEEAEVLRIAPNKAIAVYSWISNILRECATANPPKFPLPYVGTLHGNVSNLVQASLDCAMFIHCQIPYSYVHLLTMITKIHLIFVMFYAGGILQNGIQIHSWARILFAYAIVFTNQLIYEGLLHIHDVLVNPCGDDSSDFPKKMYQQDVEKMTENLLSPAHTNVVEFAKFEKKTA